MKRYSVFPALVLLILFSFTSVLSAEKQDDFGKKEKVKRDSFYSLIQTEFGFSKTDCDTAGKSGFSPYYAFKLLCIAKEAQKPVSTLIAMAKNGDSWLDMCQDFNIDYAALMDSVNRVIIDKNITFPESDETESKNNVSTGIRKRGVK